MVLNQLVIRNNNVANGAMNLISFSQVFLESGAYCDFTSNTGRYSNLFSLTEKPVLFADLVQLFQHYLAPLLQYLSKIILIRYASFNILILSYLHYSGM